MEILVDRGSMILTDQGILTAKEIRNLKATIGGKPIGIETLGNNKYKGKVLMMRVNRGTGLRSKNPHPQLTMCESSNILLSDTITNIHNIKGGHSLSYDYSKLRYTGISRDLTEDELYSIGALYEVFSEIHHRNDDSIVVQFKVINSHNAIFRQALEHLQFKYMDIIDQMSDKGSMRNSVFINLKDTNIGVLQDKYGIFCKEGISTFIRTLPINELKYFISGYIDMNKYGHTKLDLAIKKPIDVNTVNASLTEVLRSIGLFSVYINFRNNEYQNMRIIPRLSNFSLLKDILSNTIAYSKSDIDSLLDKLTNEKDVDYLKVEGIKDKIISKHNYLKVKVDSNTLIQDGYIFKK